MSQIRTSDLGKTYKINGTVINAVNGVSVNIEKGEFVSIIGHSGSGKTTLLSLIGGILRQSSGSVFFNGTNISEFNDSSLSAYRAEKIGYIFQFASLLPVLTARENLLLPTIFTSKPCNNEERKIEEYLGMVNLSDKIHAYPSQLSGGQQRRVAIARALMNDPSVILADEPTGDLDEETEKDVINILKKINRERDITLILVTHNSELSKEASRRFRMNSGHLYEV